MTAEYITDVYAGSLSYITIVNLGKVYVHLPKHQNVCDAVKAQVDILHIKDERYSYPAWAHANNSDSLGKVV